MLKDDVAVFERTTCGSGVADKMLMPRWPPFAEVAVKDTCCATSFCGGAVLSAAGDREGGDSTGAGLISAALGATAGRHGEGCCAAGWGRMGWLNAAECAVLNRLMLLGGRLFCHSRLGRRRLPLCMQEKIQTPFSKAEVVVDMWQW